MGLSDIGGKIFDTAAAFGINFLNNTQAEKREARAREENYYYNEKAAWNADKRTRQLYADLYSPGAQLQQIKDAGLSPSMFYGDAKGISGQAGAQGAGVAGVEPHTFGLDPLTTAQIANLNANARKTNAEADTEQGKNERGAAEIENIYKDNDMKQALTHWYQFKSEREQIDNVIAKESMPDQIKIFKEKAEYMEYLAKTQAFEAANKGLECEYNQRTIDTRVEKLNQDLAETISRIALQHSELKSKELERDECKARIRGIFAKIQTDWNNYRVNEMNATSSRINAEAYEKWIDAQIPTIQKQLELEADKLKLQNKKLWVDAGVELIKTAGYMMQIYLLKGKSAPAEYSVSPTNTSVAQ